MEWSAHVGSNVAVRLKRGVRTQNAPGGMLFGRLVAIDPTNPGRIVLLRAVASGDGKSPAAARGAEGGARGVLGTVTAVKTQQSEIDAPLDDLVALIARTPGRRRRAKG